MRSKSKDYYAILGVKREDDVEAIKKAYRQLALQYHPDRNPDKGAEEKFKEISEAYQVLSDPEAKQRYDRTGSADNNGFDFSGFPGFDFFANFGPGSRQGARHVRKQRWMVSPDNKVAYHLQPEQIFKDSKVEIGLRRHISCEKCFGEGRVTKGGKCKTCNGMGKVQQQNSIMFFVSTCPECMGNGNDTENCKECHGAGYNDKVETIYVSVPAGLKPQSMLKVKEKGNEIYDGNNRKHIGDLYLIIDYPSRIKNVAIDEGNIYLNVKIPIDLIFAEEKISIDVLGCKQIELKLRSDKPSGHEYALEGAGVTQDKSAFIKVFADIPQNKIGKKDREKILSVLRDIYGKSSTNY